MPKLVDHDQYRKELLSKCLNLIAEKGYNAITMRQLAQGLGVSTGTLYHYFPSKENLFEQLVEYISYQDTSDTTIAEVSHPDTIAGRLSEIFDYIAQQEDYFLHQSLMLIDFSRQRSREEINNYQALRHAGERYEQALMQVLGIQDPTLMMLLMSVFDGIIVRRLYQGDRVSITDQAAVFCEMLTAYLEKIGQLPTYDPASTG
jgi:AcrR family transcriptional regulator